MHAQGLVDPWLRWKDAKIRSFRQALPLYIALVVAYLVLIGFAIRGLEPWAIAALSSTVIVFGAELTCYYYAFVIIPALLYIKVRKAGEWMLWMAAITQFVGIAPIPGMSKALDEQYTWMSVATLVAFVLIAWALYKSQKAQLATPEGVVVDAPQPESDKADDAKQADDAPASATASPPTKAKKRRR